MRRFNRKGKIFDAQFMYVEIEKWLKATHSASYRKKKIKIT